jgi:tetratricopeptide (TPR) repeat protein
MLSMRGLFGVLAFCLVLAAPALAADSTQGQAAFAEGRKLFLAGDFRGALTWFKNGYVQSEDSAFLLNIAQCHRSLGDNSEALMMFRLYLKSSSEGANPDARAVASKAIKELESEATASTRAALPAAAVAAPPRTLAAEPALLPAPPGARKFQLGQGGMPVLEPTPELDAARAAEGPAKAPDAATATRHLRLAAMACGAVGLVAVGTGIYYWRRASSLSDSANQTAVYKQSYYDDGKRAETMQWVFYGAGAAAVAAGAGLFVYSKWFVAPKNAHVSLAPVVAPGTTGLAATGAF